MSQRAWRLVLASLAIVLAASTASTAFAGPRARRTGTPARIYYIATNGVDRFRCGAIATPCASLGYAVANAAPGDTWIVENGVYGPPASCRDADGDMAATIDKPGTATSPITLKARSKWGAVLDGEARCHSMISLGPNSAWWIIQDFDIERGAWGGIWSNSKGGKHITIKGNHIHDIGNRHNPTTLGEAGIYTDAEAIMVIDGNVINDVGRRDDSGGARRNSFDHGVYSHGAMTIVNNLFYRALWGWHIQAAAGFSGLIANNTFIGPNMYPHGTRDGSIMLWGAAGGPITIRNNIFLRPHDAPIQTSGFSSRGCIFDHNLTDANSIFDNGASCTLESNMVDTDPMLRNAALDRPDAHLQAQSPARGVGVTVAEAAVDLDGVERLGGAFDLGAFGYVP